MKIMAKSETTNKRAAVPPASLPLPLPVRKRAQSKPAEVDARPPPMIDGVLLDKLPPDQLLTVEQVLTLIPAPLTRRQWLDGVRAKRFPDVAVRFSLKLMYWRVDDIRAYIRSLRSGDGA